MDHLPTLNESRTAAGHVSCGMRSDPRSSEHDAVKQAGRQDVLTCSFAFVAHPQLAGLVGADATAADGQQALREAHRVVGAQARGR